MENKSSNGRGMTPERRARINRLKKTIVIIDFSIIFIAILCCILLIFKVGSMNKKIESLEKELAGQNSTDEETQVGLENEQGMDNKNNSDIYEPDPVLPNPEPEKVAYLTFDDGPSDNTEAILDILDQYNVKATFFVNGKDFNTYAKWYAEIVNRGNSLGMHSYTHEFASVYESLESFKADTERIHQFLFNLTGLDIKLYRFPGGSSTTQTTKIDQFIEYLDSVGYVYYDWNVSSGDATAVQIPKNDIVNNVIEGVTGKDKVVILMHDASVKNTTVEALPEIIEYLLEQGYEILPITESSTPVHHTIN